MNRISVLFFLVDLCFSYLFIHEIGKLRVMCGIPLNYGNILLGNIFSNKTINTTIIQKKTLRIINKRKFRDHTKELFTSNKILRSDKLTYYNTLIYMHKQYHNQLQTNLTEIHI